MSAAETRTVVDDRPRFEGAWEAKRLGEVVTLHSGHHVLAQYCNKSDNGIPYLTGPADFPAGRIEKTSFTTRPGTTCKPGDILITVKGSGSGQMCIADAIYCISRQLMAIRAEVCDRMFLHCWLAEHSDCLRASATGLIPGLSREDILGLSTVLPPLPEQRAIAAALSDVDDLLQSLDRLIAKKRNIKTGAMQQLLTGKTRLPGFSGKWETKRLGEIGEVSGSGVDKKSRDGETAVRLVNYLDAYRGRPLDNRTLNHWVTAPAGQVQRCQVVAGDVFFTPSSEVPDDIARSAVAKESIPDATYSYHVVRLRPSIPIDLDFRQYMCNTPVFFCQAHRLCSGSGTRYTLSLPQFRSLQISLPPLPEQRAIAAVLSDMDAEIDALEARRTKTAAIKRGMMQELLTGRTRLPIPQEHSA